MQGHSDTALGTALVGTERLAIHVDPLQNALNKYDGNYAMALAAYNAGPSRVDRWIRELGDPRTGRVSLVNWIEMIPIYETRNYVQRVLEGVYVYRQTLSTNKGRTEGGIRMALQ